MKTRPILLLALSATLGFALRFYQPWADSRQNFFVSEAEAAPRTDYASEPADHYKTQELISGLDSPWDVAVLNDSEILLTEKPGRLLRINLETGEKTQVSGVPDVVYRGQGGLFSVLLHPQFKTNGLLYLSYAAEVSKRRFTTRVLRARLESNALKEANVIFSAQAEASATHHFGGAMVFGPQGHLFISVGDRGARHESQSLGVHNGKVLRLNDDGSVPQDNPFIGQRLALAEIYSYGHRNPQGMDMDPASGTIWEAEHGPRGGDEINSVRPGLNYGWPVITYGKEYVGGSIGEGTSKAGMEQPSHYYVPSIATAGVAYYNENLFPDWKGSVFVAALRGQLNRVQMRDGKFESEHRLLEDIGQRVRAVRVLPNGELLIATEQGALIRVYR